MECVGTTQPHSLSNRCSGRRVEHLAYDLGAASGLARIIKRGRSQVPSRAASAPVPVMPKTLMRRRQIARELRGSTYDSQPTAVSGLDSRTAASVILLLVKLPSPFLLRTRSQIWKT